MVQQNANEVYLVRLAVIHRCVIGEFGEIRGCVLVSSPPVSMDIHHKG